MFDIGGSELLVIAVIALLVVGPKELPALLRTIGRVVGAIRRQAQQFRQQFDEAIRDTEFEDLKKSVDELKEEARAGFRDAGAGLENDLSDVRAATDDIVRDIDGTADTQAESPPGALADETGAGHSRSTPSTDKRVGTNGATVTRDGERASADGGEASGGDAPRPAAGAPS